MNREWVLGARSIISSDSIICRCRMAWVLNDLDGSEGDALRELALITQETALVVTKILMSKAYVRSTTSIVP